jgi:hypothetical protein
MDTTTIVCLAFATIMALLSTIVTLRILCRMVRYDRQLQQLLEKYKNQLSEYE